MEIKSLLGYIASAIIVMAYMPYIWHTYLKKTKPHAFSWFIWTLLTGTGFGIQLTQHGGAGAWILGITSIMSLVVFIFALIQGERNIAVLDRIFLASSLTAFMLWWFAKQPLASIILVTFTDTIGYMPTFRKSFHKPFEETVSLYVMGIIAYVISLFALENYSIITVMYPIAIVAMNTFLVSMIWARRAVFSFTNRQ